MVGKAKDVGENVVETSEKAAGNAAYKSREV